ncbi:hypothetical protein [Paenibacillus macerans]|uniref:hypothetical protein n=1 Tax=Paenibacillus macerans TaxID=44252 RepID=UPI0020425EC7|nr:hypothetical protein [Paenibacillus macerans]MCM3701730.1 hypothetical protein [Paenibacillus macerans]
MQRNTALRRSPRNAKVQAIFVETRKIKSIFAVDPIGPPFFLRKNGQLLELIHKGRHKEELAHQNKKPLDQRGFLF